MSQRKTTPPPEPEVKDQAPAAETAKASNKKAPRPDEMTAEALEFITAIDEYKRIHQRPFPSWSEILDVVKELGYTR